MAYRTKSSGCMLCAFKAQKPFGLLKAQNEFWILSFPAVQKFAPQFLRVKVHQKMPFEWHFVGRRAFLSKDVVLVEPSLCDLCYWSDLAANPMTESLSRFSIFHGEPNRWLGYGRSLQSR